MKFSLFLGCVLLSTLVAASGHTFDSKLDEDWKIWKSQHEKQYSEEEETHRRSIWEDNVRYIEQHNLEYSMGKHTFTVGMNEFGDLTDKEFNERMNGFLPIEADNSTEEVDGDELDEDVESDGDEDAESDEGDDELDEDAESDEGDDELDEDAESDEGDDELDEDVESDGDEDAESDEDDDELDEDAESDEGDDDLDEDAESDDNWRRVYVDWRTKGYVTPVKNQQNCGSCWAFSATGAIEGQWYRKTKKLISLSEQNLVDCSKPFGNNGCRGGWMSYAFKYILKAGGINSAQDYPYIAQDGICKFQRTKIAAKITGYKRVRRCTRCLAKAVRSVGPIAVAIDAGGPFRWYRKGIYWNRRCRNHGVNHAVLVVGYGKERRRLFWLVKNSWGTGWGDKGYIKMAMRVWRNCGITRHAIYPTV